MKCPLPSVLEELVFGGLEREQRARVLAHGAHCAECARELAWLRAEQRVLHAHRLSAGPLPPLSAVLERSRALAPRYAPSLGTCAALSLCAAAVLLLAFPEAWRGGAGSVGEAAPVTSPQRVPEPVAGDSAFAATHGVCWDVGASCISLAESADTDDGAAEPAGAARCSSISPAREVSCDDDATTETCGGVL